MPTANVPENVPVPCQPSTSAATGFLHTAASYAGNSHPQFNIEGVAFRDWRGTVWEVCYAIMADVEAGNRSTPDISTLISELPILNLI